MHNNQEDSLCDLHKNWYIIPILCVIYVMY